MCEVVVYRGHPAMDVPYGVHVNDLGGFFDARAGESLLDYGLVPAFLFCARPF
jgi:hypothetical protein